VIAKIFILFVRFSMQQGCKENDVFIPEYRYEGKQACGDNPNLVNLNATFALVGPLVHCRFFASF
jgi:hypothetical protein